MKGRSEGAGSRLESGGQVAFSHKHLTTHITCLVCQLEAQRRNMNGADNLGSALEWILWPALEVVRESLTARSQVGN